MTVFTPDEIETARKMFAGDWQFRSAASSVDTLPPMQDSEIAFAGRSNVGKSSLINALTGRNALARTSHTPGRTQELIFFQGPRFTLVDMPGYGYAEAPVETVRKWTRLINAYLKGRANLIRVYVLIDSRHGIKESDKPTLDLLGKSAVSHQFVLTKADQIKGAQRDAVLESIHAEIAKRPAAFPDVILTSSRDAQGMPELRAAILRLLSERNAA